MTVLIKGMEMPENCCECGVEWCERWKGLIIAGMSIAKARPSDCPLVEVPAPHGRLIDADALMELYEPAPGDVNEWEHYTTTVSVIRQNIKDQPTVIEAEKEG